MKKICLTIVCLLLMVSTCFAKEDNKKEVTNPKDFEISMMPKETEEEIERNRWSVILENDLGIYAYDMSTIGFAKDDKGKENMDIVEADIKTVFLGKDTIKQVNAKYAKHLKKSDTTSYCLLHMIFNTTNNTYKSTAIKVMSKKEKVLEDKKVEQRFLPVPEKTFAEAMLEIAKQYKADSTTTNQ